MDYTIRLVTESDLDDVENIYKKLIEYLDENHLGFGWKKGIYPNRQVVESGLIEKDLFVLEINGCIVGTIILNNKQAKSYKNGDWKIKANKEQILVVHTLAVHPDYLNQGIGKKLMQFAEKYGVNKEMKVIRLDTVMDNFPAIRLYEKLGYSKAGVIDLEFNLYPIKPVILFELEL